MKQTVMVFAAASLKHALDEILEQAPMKAVVSSAGSPALARQIERGAPADLFIPADLDWMDYLDQRRLIKPGTRVNLLRNSLVLVSPAGMARDVEIKPGMPLAALLGKARLAMADPDSVPAGRYGKAALEKLGVWSTVTARVARAENVRAALRLVSRGEAPFGIVYSTDAAADRSVSIVGRFTPDLHPPIVYPAALLAASTNPDAARLLAHLRAPSAVAIWRRHGFTPVD